MKVSAELIEQAAQVCWEAQRALHLAEGMSALNVDIPPVWILATYEDKHVARCRVKLFLQCDEVPPDAPIADHVCHGIVKGFQNAERGTRNAGACARPPMEEVGA